MEPIDIRMQRPDFGALVIVYGQGKKNIARLHQIRTNTTEKGVDQHFDWYVGNVGDENLWITVTHWLPIPDLKQQ